MLFLNCIKELVDLHRGKSATENMTHKEDILSYNSKYRQKKIAIGICLKAFVPILLINESMCKHWIGD